eukprot:1531522-Pyramimonas_sp.AAC.1
MLGPHWPPRLAAWLELRSGSTAGPRRSARDAPYRRRVQVGSCNGLMSLGPSAPSFSHIHTKSSTEGPSTSSMSVGL